MLRKIFVVYLTAILLCGTSCAPTPNPSSPISSFSITEIIAKYRQEIPQQMQEKNISGLAIAVVDDKNILWAEGFGYTDWDDRIPVTQNTLFSIQSMSKSFTATAAMFAAQDALVDLDEPITTYLPDFHVNSIFEEHPEQKITLRMLLSHTAGFVHEAPYGSNYDHPAYSFEKHIASISDTWLKFPVGSRYSYSNLGIDLAGYILQVRSGMPFVQYIQENVLDPLDMKDSALDVKRIRANHTRAIGHSPGDIFRPPVDFLIIPSGGVWTTAEDMARYLRFHINKGASDGDRLLNEDLVETMYTPPNPPAQNAYSDSSYALGITVSTRHGARRFQHGGGGFGFNSSMIWYPELKLGAVVLANTVLSDNFVVKLNDAVLDDLINKDPETYVVQRAKSATRVEPAYPPEKKGNILNDGALHKLIESKALPDDTSTARRRNALAGTYLILGLNDTGEIRDQNGELTITYWGNTESLTEVEPELFFTPNGETVDFRDRIPTYSNIRLGKMDRQTLIFQIVFYSICGFMFLSTLFYWPIRSVIRRTRWKNISADVDKVNHPRSSWLVWIGILAGLASLFTLFCLALIALIPNMIYTMAYIPWPRPYPDLTWWQFVFLSLPFTSLLMAIAIALLAGLNIRNNTDGRATYFYFLIVSLVLLTFNLSVIL